MRNTLLKTVLLSLGFAGIASAFEFYEWPDFEDSVTVTTQESDLWPVSNLIQGPGDGFAAEEPHLKNLGGEAGNWVTADDAGFPSDYIEEVGQPVIQFDLGRDVPLKQISTWGYAQGNSNGTSAFSLRFATDEEGPDGILDGAVVNYGESVTYNPTFFVNELDVTQHRINLFDEHVTARYVEFTNVDNHFIPDGTGNGPEGTPGVDYEERLLPYRPGGDRVGLGEVAFMVLPESFQVGDKLPSRIAGDEFGVLEIGAERSGEEFGPAGEAAPGLLQSWFLGTASDKASFDSVTSGVPVVPPFRANEMSWWSGSNDVADIPKYPEQVDPDLADAPITGDGYTVLLQGEIKIEESGQINFLDGVDDYTYLAIDTDRSGVAGDSEAEILINDNSWTDALGAANGGAPIVEADFGDVADGGEWLAIEFGMSEGGGGDSGMLYWDFGDEDELFPLDQGTGVEDLDALLLIVPDTNLQSREQDLVKADSAGTLADTYQADVFELNVQVGPDGNDQIALADVAVGDGVATLDVSGTTVRIVAEDGIAEGSEFQIFGADQLIGLDSLNLIFDDASLWDTSSLSEGRIVFGAAACNPNTLGDIDGSGDVAFADFLILSANFGQAAADHTTGDIDCSGDVAFADFLVLSANFGQAVGGAQTVPEPSGLMLLGLAGLLGGCLRRRR